MMSHKKDKTVVNRTHIFLPKLIYICITDLKTQNKNMKEQRRSYREIIIRARFE